MTNEWLDSFALARHSLVQRRQMLKSLALGIGIAPSCIHRLLADEAEPAAVGRTARVKTVDGAPSLVVDGKPIRTATFETYAPRRRYFEQFAKAGTEVFSFSTNAAACDYGHSGVTRADESTWDYSQFEQRAADVLAACPNGLLLPR